MSSHMKDMIDFNRKFGLFPRKKGPHELDKDLFEFRAKFMHEELLEFTEAWKNNDLAEQADALVDLVYVVIGTAYLMDLPWQELWDEVHRTNLRKRKPTSIDETKRGHEHDIVKPEGWTSPDIMSILQLAKMGRLPGRDFNE